MVSVLSQLYDLLKLNSDTVAVHCPTINVAMQADYSVKVTGDSCVEITNSWRSNNIADLKRYLSQLKSIVKYYWDIDEEKE